MSAPGKELQTLGRKIRSARRKLGMSQEQLSERSGLHRTYVSSVERGGRNLTIFSLGAIARALGVTISELTRGIDSDDRDSPSFCNCVH